MDDEKEDRGSCMVISGAKTDNLYPMYFGVSCAFVALEILSRSDMNGDHRWSRTRNKMLQGSAHLLGMLVWRIQRGEAMEGNLKSELLHKLEKAEIEVAELKKVRSEDAKANEKVVGIFATQEQSWLNERRKLRQQIGALMNELRVQETKKEGAIFDLNRKIKEKELVIESGIEHLKEEEGRRKEVELKLQKVEAVLEEVRETAKKEAQAHSSELWKHKNALIELISNQRQLESEMGRALRQLEASKQELDSVVKQKEDSFSMIQKLSMEILKIRKDSEQKDKILSAMLRKSKFDTTEKQILLKEVKISKSRRKQADLETERWRTLCGSRHERSSSRSTVGSQFDLKSDVYSWVKEVQTIEAECSQDRRSRSHPKALLLEYLEAEHRKDWDYIATKKSDSEFLGNSDQHSLEGSGELVIKADVKQLEDWVRYETEKHATMLEQRHNLEIDAFAEQLRLKDEKVEAFNWRLLSTELESKRLQTQIDGLEQNLSQYQEENMKLEALLLDRKAELESVKEKMMNLQFNHPHYRRTNSISSPKDLKVDHETIWSKVKIIRRKPREREEEPLPTLVRSPQVMETEKEETIPSEDKLQETIRAVQVPEEEIEVEKEVEMDPGYVGEQCASPLEVKVVDEVTSVNPCLIKKVSYPWKMDLHALGVSYKIKRLKQQLLMLEKLAGMQKSCEKRVTENNEPPRVTSFLLLMPFLNKQVSRYQTLEENTDNLLKRMHDSNLNLGHIDSSISKTKEETKILQNYLEETFQLQRYLVATGQKLMDVQSKIASDYIRGAEDAEKSAGFDMRRFANSISTLLKEVQRGLEVRIARIIGDLEGTLACEGITHLKNQF